MVCCARTLGGGGGTGGGGETGEEGDVEVDLGASRTPPNALACECGSVGFLPVCLCIRVRSRACPARLFCSHPVPVALIRYALPVAHQWGRTCAYAGLDMRVGGTLQLDPKGPNGALLNTALVLSTIVHYWPGVMGSPTGSRHLSVT